MKTITLFILITFILLTLKTSAQEENSVREVPFQITLVPPLGTNRIHAGNTINRFSLNIFAGYAAGIEGVEFGGFANINRHSTTGVQFAGFSNISGGKINAIQFAGFANINNGNTKGLQFSGFSNINNGSTNGLQSAGFVNFTREDSKLIQLAGFGNFSHNIKGVQIAGFSNISSGTIKGAQISGFLNAARIVDGVQIGFLNIADTVKNGVPIGFLSIVRNGFKEFEIGISEGLNTYASFKIGVKQFYNIFSVGIQTLGDRFHWGFGYGIGTHLADRNDYKINLELMSYHINEGAHFTNAYNDLQQAKLSFSRSLNENVSLFIGPTFNLMISDYQKHGNTRSGSGFAPYAIINNWSGHTNLKYWVGFNAGIRIH
ncbi:MAG: hypothetical protein HQ541_00570 [Mariniphaga sp.]|nr:hypothetical protein [Mariniphaga sp.]